MLSFTLNNNTFVSPSGWNEVTIERGIQFIEEVECNCPESLTEILSSGVDIYEKFVDIEEVEKMNCRKYFSKYISFWTGAKEEEIFNEFTLDQLDSGFFSILVDFINFDIDENFSGFEINSIEYLLPKKHMTESTLGEWVEAVEFEKGMNSIEAGEYKALLDIMCVLCRPKEERYDNKLNPIRKKLFKTLSMNILFNVGFFLLKLNKIFLDNFQIYLLLEQLKSIKNKGL